MAWQLLCEQDSGCQAQAAHTCLSACLSSKSTETSFSQKIQLMKQIKKKKIKQLQLLKAGSRCFAHKSLKVHGEA